MKKFSFLFLVSCILLVNTSTAQKRGFEGQYKKRIHFNTQWYKMMKSSDANVFKVEKAYDEYFRNNDFIESIETKEYKRWKRFTANKFDATGKIITPENTPEDLKILKESMSSLKTTTKTWNVVGPKKIDMESPMQSTHPVQGVIRSIEQHPTDPNKVWAGSISAGMWYTENNGVTWECVTSDLLLASIKGISVCDADPTIVYAAANTGVIKSTDGGKSWAFTSLNWTSQYPGGVEPHQMKTHPKNPNIAYYATNKGTYRTKDGGQTWDKIKNGYTWDIELHPVNSDTLYLAEEYSAWTSVYRSTNGGDSWTQLTNGLPLKKSGHEIRRMAISVSKAKPNNIWVIAAGGVGSGDSKVEGVYGFYVSEDSGNSFTNKVYGDNGPVAGTDSKPNLIGYNQSGIGSSGGQYTWDMDLAVSDTDPNMILVGGIHIWKSENGGNSWQNVERSGVTGSRWFHWDCQCLEIFGDNMWFGTDGGITLSTDKCQTVQNKSFGIVAQELWGFDQAWKTDIMAVGMYHGPIMIRDDEIYDGWYVSSGADAGNVMVNKGDDRYIYGHPWGDVKIKRSHDKNVAPVIVDFGAKILAYIHPLEIFNHSYYNTFYTLDETTVKKTTDNANNWEIMKDFGAGNKPHRISTSFSDHNVAYIIVNWNKVYKTTDGGKTWSNKTPASSVSKNKSFSSITIDGSNPDIVWLAMGGKQSDVKVLKSTNGGGSWTNYTGPSGNLPAYAINTIAHQIGTDGGVYIGTNAGVWYRNNSMNEWALFSNGLPKGIQTWFVRLNYAKEKIRIGTLRGVWECDFYEQSSAKSNPMAPSSTVALNKDVRFADHSVALEGATYSWVFEGGTPNTSTEEFPIVRYDTEGTYNVKLTVTDSRGSYTSNKKDMIKAEFVPEPVDNKGWKIVSVSSQESAAENGKAENMLDGDPSTIWHTRWSSGSDSHPHNVVVQFDTIYEVTKICYLPRQSSANGRIKNFEYYLSKTNGDWGDAVKTGIWENGAGEKQEEITPQKAKYLKLVAKSEVNGEKFASGAELTIFGTPTEYDDDNGDDNGDDNDGGDQVTDIKDELKKDFNIYTNNKTIYINYKSSHNYIVEVYNTSGQKLIAKRMRQYQEELQLQNSPKGVYIVCIKSDSGVKRKKVYIR